MRSFLFVSRNLKIQRYENKDRDGRTRTITRVIPVKEFLLVIYLKFTIK